MKLRDDLRQFTIYDPETVTAAFDSLDAAMLVAGGMWLQSVVGRLPVGARENAGTVGTILVNIGEARQQINAGLAPNDVPDRLVAAQRLWNVVSGWLQQPGSVSEDLVVETLDQFAGAMAYLNQRTMDTGTNHPRWNARIVSGEPCESCGR